jgi:DNA-binding response OmpR family regulator
MEETQKKPKFSRILCIEDEFFISELYARALNKAGYEVNVIVDGEEGLLEAKTNQYDIILLDLMVPNITGMEILNQLRGRGGSGFSGKIIITTNLEQGEQGRGELEKLADGYIVKAEVTPHELVEYLSKFEAISTE